MTGRSGMDAVCCKINAFWERKTGRWLRITSLAASVYPDALCYPALQDSESDLPSPYPCGYCGPQYYHRRGQVRDFWTHRIFRRIATSEDSRWVGEITASINGSFRRCRRLSFSPHWSSSRMPSNFGIFRFAPEFHARVRSIAFLHRQI